MAGFTVERRNYIRLLNDGDYATVDAMPANDMSKRGLASKLFKDMLDNGFKLIWSDTAPEGSPESAANLHSAKRVVFEPTTKIDPLSPSEGPSGSPPVVAKPQGYRIGFIVDGLSDNQLTAYLGSSSTMGVQGITKEYSYPVVIVQGGATAGDTRISSFVEFGYRISITSRGFAILAWAPRFIESMEYMGLLAVQRPVKYDGTPVIDGYAPVFALHNTDPVSRGRPVQTDKFFKVLVREKDSVLPGLATMRSAAGDRYATGTITFSDLPVDNTDGSCTDTNSLGAQTVLTVTINGATIQLGRGKIPVATSSAEEPHSNNMYKTPSFGSKVDVTKAMLVNAFKTAIENFKHQGLKDLNFTYDPGKGLVHIISKIPGDLGITYSSTVPTIIGVCATPASPWAAPVLSPSGSLGGGGRGWKPFSGKVTFTNNKVDSTDELQVGSVRFVFSLTPQNPPTVPGTVEIAYPDPAGPYSTNQHNSIIIDNIIIWLNANRTSYPEFEGVEFYKECSTTGNCGDPNIWNRLVFEKDPRTIGANNFTLQSFVSGSTTASADLSISGTVANKLSGGRTNQAYGTITFNALPTHNSTIEFNNVRYIFVDAAYTGFNEISTVVDMSNPNYMNIFVQRVADVLNASIDPRVSEAAYSANNNVLTITYKVPGYHGNSFTLLPNMDASVATFNTGLSLIDGAGSASADGSDSNIADEVSEITGRFGTTMYRVPNVWEGPVTTDTGEYILLFPFGFCSDKVAFTEEMDLVAISKGAAYQGIQDVSISVYGQSRTYTSYNSNLTSKNDYVRVFILTSGGDIS